MLRRLALAVLLFQAIVGLASAQQQFPPRPLPPLQPAAPASPPAAPEATRSFCGQDVGFTLADRDAVAEPYRRFVGVWSDAAWDAHTCAALIVENVKPDGSAAIDYVYGPLSSTDRVAGGVLRGTGVVRDGELRFQNADGTQFAFRPTLADLVGRMTTANGARFESGFKQTF